MASRLWQAECPSSCQMPEPVNVTALHDKGDFADVLMLKAPRWGTTLDYLVDPM